MFNVVEVVPSEVASPEQWDYTALAKIVNHVHLRLLLRLQLLTVTALLEDIPLLQLVIANHVILESGHLLAQSQVVRIASQEDTRQVLIKAHALPLTLAMV